MNGGVNAKNYENGNGVSKVLANNLIPPFQIRRCGFSNTKLARLIL